MCPKVTYWRVVQLLQSYCSLASGRLVARQEGGKLLERRGGAAGVQRTEHDRLGREVERGRERIPGARVWGASTGLQSLDKLVGKPLSPFAEWAKRWWRVA